MHTVSVSVDSQPNIENTVFDFGWLNPLMQNLRLGSTDYTFIEKKII